MRLPGSLVIAVAFIVVASISGFRFYESVQPLESALGDFTCNGTDISFLVDPTKVVLEYRLTAYLESPRGVSTVEASYRVSTLEACLGLMVGYTDLLSFSGDRELLAALSNFAPLASRPTSFLPSSYIYVYPRDYLESPLFSEAVHAGSYGVRPALVAVQEVDNERGRLYASLVMDKGMGVLLYRSVEYSSADGSTVLEANVSLEKVYVSMGGNYADVELLSLYTLATGLASGGSIVLAALNARAAVKELREGREEGKEALSAPEEADNEG